MGFFDCFFDAEDQVRTAGADVGPKDVGAIAFVVDTEGKTAVWIGHFGWVTEYVDGQSANWGKEQLDVVACDEFRVGSAGIFEEGATEDGFLCSKVRG